MIETELTPALRQVINLTETAVNTVGCSFVKLRLLSGRRTCLQVMIENISGDPITLDDCVKVSRTMSAILDEQDPIQGYYHLEVSSPGLQRPLFFIKDFKRFCGHLVSLTLHRVIDEHRKWQGKLVSLTESGIMLEKNDQRHIFNFNDIREAYLIEN